MPPVATMKYDRTRWRVVPLLMGITFISHLNRVSMAVAGDERIMDQFAISPTRMGMIYSAFLFAYTLCMTPAGILADRFGVWLALGLMALGTATFGVLTGLLGFGLLAGGQMWIALLVVRSIMGGLNAPLHPSSARTVANWIPTSQRGTANGLAVSAAALGIASTYYVFGALIDRVDWPVAFLITGGVTAGLGILWLALAGDSPTGRRVSPVPTQTIEQGQTGSDWSRLVRKPGLARLTLSYAALNYFEYLFFYWMLYYFGSVLGLGSDTSRIYSTIVGLAMAVGMLSGGFLTDRLERILGHRRGRVAVPITGMITGAIMLGIGVMAREPVWVVVWFSLALGSVTAAEASFWTTAVELGGTKGTTAAGILNTGGNVGGMAAPVVTPWVGTVFGWQWALALGALVAVLGALQWRWIVPERESLS